MSTTLASPAFSARAVRWRASQILLPPIVMGIGYYLGCLAGFAARFPSSGISFFWPPTALLTAALLLTAQRTWPGLLAAAFVAHAIAHAQNGVPFAAWPIQFLGNATQAALAAFIVRRYSTGTSLFSDLRHVLAFILGASVVAPAVASLIPAYAYVHLGWAPDFPRAWVARTVSNAAASLTLVPSIVMAWRYLWPKPHGIPRRLAEYRNTADRRLLCAYRRRSYRANGRARVVGGAVRANTIPRMGDDSLRRGRTVACAAVDRRS